MNKRRLIWIGSSVIGFLALCIAGWMIYGPSEIRLTQADIQSQLDNKLPIPGDTISVENATVAFTDNQAYVQIWLTASAKGQTGNIQIGTLGQPSYDPLRGSFYFKPTNVEIIETTFNGGEETLSSGINKLADRYLGDKETTRNLVEDFGPDLEKLLIGTAETGAELLLNRVPIYTLEKDAKGIAAMAVLGGVTVEGEELVIDFTLWRLGWWALIAVFTVVLSIVLLFAMMRSPGLFAATTILGGL